MTVRHIYANLEEKGSSYRNTEFQRRRKVLLNMLSVWIVAPEDLIISKLDWAKDSFSELQLLDVQNLLHTIKDLDQKYMLHWIEKLGLERVFKKVKNERYER